MGKMLDQYGAALEEAVPADPEAKRVARTTVADAVTALINLDLEAHLTHVTEDVRLQLGENGTTTGKQQYRHSIELFLFGHEKVTSFEIRHVLPLDQSRFLVIVRETHELRPSEGSPVQQSEIINYRVDEGKIAEVNWTSSGRSRIIVSLRQ